MAGGAAAGGTCVLQAARKWLRLRGICPAGDRVGPGAGRELPLSLLPLGAGPVSYTHLVAAGGELATTAAVNLADYVRTFTELSDRYDFVIHVNISSDFSCSHQNAKLAAADLPNVYVVDSRNLSTGHGHIVLEAARMAAEGMEPEEIVRQLEALTARVDASFILEQLEYMKKSGRCSAVALLGANLLKLRPCIEVKDGKMGVAKKYRGTFAKCLEAYIADRLAGRDDIELGRIFITPVSSTHLDVSKRQPLR